MNPIVIKIVWAVGVTAAQWITITLLNHAQQKHHENKQQTNPKPVSAKPKNKTKNPKDSKVEAGPGIPNKGTTNRRNNNRAPSGKNETKKAAA